MTECLIIFVKRMDFDNPMNFKVLYRNTVELPSVDSFSFSKLVESLRFLYPDKRNIIEFSLRYG